jgi:stage II sporulation protein AA (anti-sigma F factor antagonist)
MSSEAAPPPGRLVITSETDAGTARLTLEGELDLASAGQVEEQLSALEADRPERILIDLGGLAFIDSTGLRTLIQADQRAREAGSELVLRPGDESIQRVFELTGALDVLRFEPA